MPGNNREPDRLNQSWSQVSPRYSNQSALSAQITRYVQDTGKTRGKGWIGRIICQLSFILLFFVPGGLFLISGFQSDWIFGLLGLLPISIGLLLSYFIWKK